MNKKSCYFLSHYFWVHVSVHQWTAINIIDQYTPLSYFFSIFCYLHVSVRCMWTAINIHVLLPYLSLICTNKATI